MGDRSQSFVNKTERLLVGKMALRSAITFVRGKAMSMIQGSPPSRPPNPATAIQGSPPSRPSILATAIMTGFHAILLSPLVIFLLLMVPRYEKTFRDFNMKLPVHTEWVLSASRWAGDYYPWFLGLFVAFLAWDAAILFLLRQGLRNTRSSWVWFGLVTFGAVIILVGAIMAMLLPLAKLLEGLSK
jgi:hypothetical protein